MTVIDGNAVSECRDVILERVLLDDDLHAGRYRCIELGQQFDEPGIGPVAARHETGGGVARPLQRHEDHEVALGDPKLAAQRRGAKAVRLILERLVREPLLGHVVDDLRPFGRVERTIPTLARITRAVGKKALRVEEERLVQGATLRDEIGEAEFATPAIDVGHRFRGIRVVEEDPADAMRAEVVQESCLGLKLGL